jgi:hypothetical protein
MSTQPRLLVVDLAAVQTELDTLREDYIERGLEARRSERGDYLEREGELVAVVAEWAESYPALELLREEIR